MEADNKIRHFVGDIKEFADRVYSFASFRLEDIIGVEQSISHLEMGKKGKKAAKKNSANDVVSDSATEESPVTQEPTEGVKNITENESEPRPEFDGQLLVELAEKLLQYDTERLQNVQTQMLLWVSLDPNLNYTSHHSAILPSVYSVLSQLADILASQRVGHQQAKEQMDADFKEKEESLRTGFEGQQFAAAVELQRVREQLNSLSQDLAQLEFLRREAGRLEKEVEEGHQVQEQLKQQNEEQAEAIRAKDAEASEMKTTLEQSQNELEAAKKRMASLMEQGDELYRKLFEMHQEEDQVDALRMEVERARRREEELEEKFGELHAVYGTMEGAFEEHLKKGKILAEEKEKERKRVEEMEDDWQQQLADMEDRLAEATARLDKANESIARKDFLLAKLELDVEALKAATVDKDTRMTENLQRSDDDLKATNEHLQAALEARTRELNALQASVDELSSDAVFSYQELQNLSADRQRLSEELNDARFQLEQAEETEQASCHAAAKIRDLQRRISLKENEHYEQMAQVTLQLQNREEQLMGASEKEVELLENNESLKKENAEWRSRCESLSAEVQAQKEKSASVKDLESSLSEAKECSSSLLAENASLRSQLAATYVQKNVAEEQIQGLAAQLQERPSIGDELTDNQLKFRFVELESRLLAAERERDSLRAAQAVPRETRILMEADTSSAVEGASDLETAVPSASTSDHHSLMGDVVEHVRHSTLVRAGAPVTAPLIRKLRSFLSRRAIRPYLRYVVAGYFFIVHFLLINSWLL